ncbi:MAG: hypothetical protein P4M00_10250 [Azospirillaceae bacterium]|nr:hypothetical protein [Azospirillaceae bacterium]
MTRRQLSRLILGAAALALAGCGKKIRFPDPPDDAADVPYPRGYPNANTDPKPRGEVQ